MIGKIEELLRRVEEFRPKTAAEVEEFRIKVLGKKGELNALMEEFKRVAPELKREVGQRLNALKQAATERVAALIDCEDTFEDGIRRTIRWYLDNRPWWEHILAGEYQDYYEKMYANR